MRRSLLLTLALWLCGSAAESLSSDVTSLNYYPHRGRLEILPELSATTRDENFNSNGSATYTKTEQLILTTSYGIAHRLRLTATESLTIGQTRESVTAKDLAVDSSATGIANPTLTLAWRAFDSRGDGLSGDLGLSVSPSFGDKSTDNGAAGHQGNQLSGSWNSSAAASLFWRWGLSEMEAREVFTQVFNGHTDGNGPSTTFATRPYSMLTTAIFDRVHFGGDFFVQLGLTFNPVMRTQNTYDNGVTRTNHLPAYAAGHFSLGYRLEKTTLLELGGSWHQDSVLTTSSTGTDVSNRNESFVILLSFLKQI